MTAIFLSILCALSVYFYFRLLAPLQARPALFWACTLLLLVGMLAIAWLPLCFWSAHSAEVRAHEAILERTAHLAMGFLSLLLALVVVRDLLGFLPRVEFSGMPASLTLLGGAFLLSVIGYVTAQAGPVLREIPLTTDPTRPRLRIVQISDLHVGTWIRRPYVERLAAQITALGPIDLLILTGDIGDGDPEAHRDDLAPLARVEARIGKFSVSGNHEGYWNEEAWRARIRELGFRDLANEGVELKTPIGPLTVHGVSDSRADPARALANRRDGVFSLFLAHQPHHAEAAIAAGVDLQLSGHTHAGQFLPWTLIIGRVHRFAAGLYRVGPTAIYVNRGTGFWGPPFRLGSRSETTLLEVDLVPRAR